MADKFQSQKGFFFLFFRWKDLTISVNGFDVAVFMVKGVSLGKSFWVVNTWPALVRKRHTLAHTFLTDCCTKPCVFPNNELFVFYCNNLTGVQSVFSMKTVKTRLFRKYLERRKSQARFCSSLGWLHISLKKLLKTTILLLQELKI